jgi:hypothetical protein
MNTKTKTIITYSLLAIGLWSSPYLMALTTRYSTLLTTENGQNILPPNESGGNNTHNSVANDEVIFRQQLEAMSQHQTLVNMAQQKNSKKEPEPTTIFFNSLLTCSSGTYYEKNNLSEFLGPTMLAHNIIGIKGSACIVKLLTPNGKFATCEFGIDALQDIDDEYMIEGLSGYNEKNTSQKSIMAELSWSAIKIKHCVYSNHIEYNNQSKDYKK